ncbi:MAG: preprotein translocase subunit SecA, partial [Eggerthellaceae bacterium]|nr:preprotein translocase subunit SecA [Eggerthellaceae bacterium]
MAPNIAKILSFGNDKILKEYRQVVDVINSREVDFVAMSDDELLSYSNELQEKAQNGSPLDDLKVDAFALVREAAKRTLGQRHFDVQLIGALALHDGSIAEMKTGEGKTLVSTAAGYLNALDGSNVHVVTVNDYLAQRDSDWMGQVYNLLGMHTGVILNNMEPGPRHVAYGSNVTYGTNSEFGFDYLRDNMVKRAEERVQRGHRFAIVDEVDSILIDEARTPLIISGLGKLKAQAYKKYANIMPRLTEDDDFIIDEKQNTIYATEEGLDKVEHFLGFNIYEDLTGQNANLLKQALKAEFLLKRDVDYVVVDGEVKIVDEFTGRIMEGRRWSDGLHQAVEAKENVLINPETLTLATVTLQNYFRLYDKLSGMTGTAITEDSEFREIYDLPVIPIPTNKPVIRKDQPDYIFRTMKAKFEAVADEVERRYEYGQPVLVGTTSVEASERLSDILDKRGVPHQTLNAKNPEHEAHIVAQAGRPKAVTIATNMAGRGTD